MTRVLVILPGAFGDTLLALPALAGLKASYAPAFLELIGHPALLDVLPGRSVVDRMRSIDGPEWLAVLEESDALSPSVRALFARFDLAIAWMSDQDGRLARTLTGFGISRVVVKSPRLREAGVGHASGRFRTTLDGLDRPVPLLPASLVPTAHDLATGRAWLRDAGFEAGDGHVVAIHPGSGSLHKCWPVEQVAALIGELRRDGKGVLVIEGPAEGPILGSLDRLVAPIRVPRLAGAGLSTVLGVLAHCRAFLGHDSGLTHLAACIGLPTVCLFGPTDPAAWAPLGDRVTVLWGEVPCQCATEAEKKQCLNRTCLAIPVSKVREALRHAVFDAG